MWDTTNKHATPNSYRRLRDGRPQRKVLGSVVKGLNYVIQIAGCREGLHASRADASRLVDAIVAAGPVLAEMVGSIVVNERTA
jgi:hypothetical protein